MKIYQYIGVVGLALLAQSAVAQSAVGDTINRMVLVESTYNPVVGAAVKRNFLPDAVKPSMKKEAVVYEENALALRLFPHEAMEAQKMELTREQWTPGYVHVGYGLYNNYTAKAAYQWQFNPKNQLSVDGFVDGWYGKLKQLDTMPWKSRMNEMGLHTQYVHQFEHARLMARLSAERYDYNYLQLPDSTARTDNQAADALSAEVGLEGTAKGKVMYGLYGAFTRFGRRNVDGRLRSNSEHHSTLEAMLGWNMGKKGKLLATFNYQNLFYHGLVDYKNYHSLTITPEWKYTSDLFAAKVGMNVDILMGMKPVVQASPECAVRFIPADFITLEWMVDGGRTLPDFQRLYRISPYWGSDAQLTGSYDFVNTRLRVNVRLYEGTHLEVHGGYRIADNELFVTKREADDGLAYTGLDNRDAQVANVGGVLTAGYKDIFTLRVAGDYNYWKAKGDREILARAPEVNVDALAKVHIWKGLYAQLGFQYVQFTKVSSYEKVPAIMDLNLGLKYGLNKYVSFFLDAHNLTNQRYEYYYGYPAQGFNMMVGAAFKF